MGVKIWGLYITTVRKKNKMESDLNGVVFNLQQAEETIKTLKERIDGMENGKKCESSQCEFCKHSGVVYADALFNTNYLYGTKLRTKCLKKTLCPDFERKE